MATKAAAGGSSAADAAADANAAAENWQQQLDELTALTSIYEDDVRVLRWPGGCEEADCSGDDDDDQEDDGSGGGGGPSSLLRALERASALPPPPPPSGRADLVCELLVHVDVPPERGVQVALAVGAADGGSGSSGSGSSGSSGSGSSGSSGSGSSGSGSSGSSGSGSSGGRQNQSVPFGPPLLHLSPLRLVARLPPAYPSSAPPARLEVSAAWLSARAARRLERALLPPLSEDDDGNQAPPPRGIEGSEDARWQPGVPALFAWAEFLRDRALGEVAESDDDPGAPLVLVLRDGQDAAAADEEEEDDEDDPQPHHHQSSTAEALALRLQRYSTAREADVFSRRLVRCGICMEEAPGSTHLLRLTPQCAERHPPSTGDGGSGSGATFCLSCLQQHAESLVASGAVGSLCCPDPSCRAPIPADVLRDQNLLSKESFERWERLLLQRALHRMPDVVYCPRCASSNAPDAEPSPCIEDPNDRLAQCARCGFAFCGVCSQSFHPGRPCLDEEARLIVLERRGKRAGDAANAAGGALAAAQDARREADAAAQLLSLRAIREATRACPGCGSASVRTEGCNKMTCPACATLWCWRCGCAISGYDHFKQTPTAGAAGVAGGGGGGGAGGGEAAAGAAPAEGGAAEVGAAPPPTATTTTTGGCRLFEQEEIDRWQRRMEAQEREQAMAAAREGLLPAGVAVDGLGVEMDPALQAALEADAAARLQLRQRERQQGADGGAAAAAELAAARAAAREARRAAAAAIRRASSLCPVCGQVNARHRGSNLVRCWACLQHHCAACRAWLRQRPVAAHFRGKGACPQHDAGGPLPPRPPAAAGQAAQAAATK